MPSEPSYLDTTASSDNSGRSELFIAVGLLAILGVILVPLPAAVMDVLLIVNLTMSLMILMTTACLVRPLELSVFPSLLLVVTFFRLALNIGTTRLILGEAQAGGVIEAFANFVAGRYVVVGFIVFAIIMIVQFVVITKGSTRISEVAARFTLDAMPGRQLSIDSDVSAGIIDESAAREMREEITREADFYGAMDGATKFVRGEAVAGIFITFVNILAGFCIGTLEHGMEIPEAAERFTRLTIGDGLVSQIPALMVSVATALLVTKNAGGENIGRDVGNQLLTNSRVLFVAAGFLTLLVVSGLPVIPLLVGAGVCVILGLRLNRSEDEDEFEEHDDFEETELNPEESYSKDVRELLPIEPIELELGFRLVGFVDEERGGDLLERLSHIREQVALDLGFVIPPVKVHDNIRLRPTEYSIKLRGNSLGSWRVYADRLFAKGKRQPDEAFRGREGRDPITAEEGIWIDESQCPVAASAGWSVRSAPELIVEHLQEIVQTRAAEILTREEVARLLSGVRARAPTLLDELVPSIYSLGVVHRVLQMLLRERVSIRDLETILEVLADHPSSTPQQLAEKARLALSRAICNSAAGQGRKVRAILLDPSLEETLHESLVKSGGAERLDIEPGVAESLARRLVSAVDDRGEPGEPVVIVCPGQLRRHLRELTARESPGVVVLAYDEIAEEFELDPCASVALQGVDRP